MKIFLLNLIKYLKYLPLLIPILKVICEQLDIISCEEKE